MATTAKSAHHIDPRSGYCAATKIFHSLRPAVQLPPPTLLLSFPSFAFSVLPSPLPSHPALLDAVSGEAVSFPAFVSQVRALAVSLCSRLHLSRGDVAFVLAPARLDVPVLYFALLSIGAVVSPANPASTADEVARLVALSNSSVAFAVSTTAGKLPGDLPTVLLDSPQFRSFLYHSDTSSPEAVVRQSDTAVIQYSSGTTGSTKATALRHRCFIVSVAVRRETMPTGQQRVLLSAPIFHSMGFLQALAMPALGVTSVVMTATAAGAGTRGIMEIVERCRVTQMGAAPPLVVAMASGETVAGCDVTSLQEVTCGGAPLRDAVAMTFRKRFPGVLLRMGYGTTEAGPISIMLTPDECSRLGSVGRLHYGVEAKIVDHVTGLVLSAGQTGELYVRGHYVMKGYVGDDEANSAAFDSDGWLKTGDLCYIDRDGFVFIVDRLKELIKYKGYQVAPGELEQLLHSLPGIIDAVVIPYPNDAVGQIPMALIVREHGSNITETEIMEYIAKKIAPCKKVRKVMFVDSIPKSPTGKIVRRELTKSVICGSLSRL